MPGTRMSIKSWLGMFCPSWPLHYLECPESGRILHRFGAQTRSCWASQSLRGAPQAGSALLSLVYTSTGQLPLKGQEVPHSGVLSGRALSHSNWAVPAPNSPLRGNCSKSAMFSTALLGRAEWARIGRARASAWAVKQGRVRGGRRRGGGTRSRGRPCLPRGARPGAGRGARRGGGRAAGGAPGPEHAVAGDRKAVWARGRGLRAGR